ncbi:uncharacterized protein LOC105184757 isoform X2 [Harpegnathos saltator]|uniref:uncharacterized protein LOC105184757 isoform X2 n=1 Tax=Harpegnathos saltator TaxID=610380 RepID=UPI00058F187A|nr:uncharacterized protein LOC105184757 isoform X2 [Harpegnathos saltator]
MQNTSREMIKWYSWIIFITLGVIAQDISYKDIAPELRECYDNKYLYEKDNRLPHTLNTLIALIRKIENAEGLLNMDLRTLTIGIMHRFRQDGIIENPNVSRQPGVSPYAPMDEQAAKFTRTLSFIPQRTAEIPHEVLTNVEKCTLHFMLSDSIEIFERGDENVVCKFTNDLYRRARSVNSNHSIKENFNIHDVETLTPEQIDVITNHKDVATEDTIDPNALYPELPPNHPKVARVLSMPPYSNCPVENGIIKTIWGPVSIGSVIAGIAAGLQPETVKLSDLFPRDVQQKPYLSKLSVDNKWIATISGDLAEVTLIQGPTGRKLKVGVSGNWNSSAIPRWYFLKYNDSLEFTTAEIRGGLDGLILANEVEFLYSKIPTLKLSQILDMYYSAHGLFDHSIRACNRGSLFTALSSNASETMAMQSYSASLVLKQDLQTATMDDNVIEDFAKIAANELSTNAIPSMHSDLSCKDTETGDFKDTVQISADLTIILDTMWPFNLIQPIIANLLDNMKINQYNSQFTIINGNNGNIMMNITNNILDFSYYNITNYENVTSSSAGFDLAKSLDKLESIQTIKLNNERSGLGNGKSDIILIIPYTSSVPDPDKEYCKQQLNRMREQVPDATILVLTYGPKERWSDYVNDITTDLFSAAISENQDGALQTVLQLITRIRQVPQRLINTECGANYSPAGATNSFDGYIEPNTVIYYRLHPNYFYSSDSSHYSTIKIEPSVWGILKVCTSRQPMNVDSPEGENVQCTLISDKAFTVSFSCNEAQYIHSCQPFYMSIIANSSAEPYECTDILFCRFPHMIKYKVHYENLICTSSANINLFNIVLLITTIIYLIDFYSS